MSRVSKASQEYGIRQSHTLISEQKRGLFLRHLQCWSILSPASQRTEQANTHTQAHSSLSSSLPASKEETFSRPLPLSSLAMKRRHAVQAAREKKPRRESPPLLRSNDDDSRVTHKMREGGRKELFLFLRGIGVRSNEGLLFEAEKFSRTRVRRKLSPQ